MFDVTIISQYSVAPCCSPAQYDNKVMAKFRKTERQPWGQKKKCGTRRKNNIQLKHMV